MVRTLNIATTAILSLLTFTTYTSASSDHLVRFRKRASTAKYPPALATPPKSSLPQDWIDALDAAVAAGKIPNIPTSVESANGVTYPSSAVGSSKKTCSWTVSKCNGPDDITDAPDGEWTIAFDDGPTAASPALYQFLQQNNQAGTHFMIGSQILAYPKAFQEAIATNQEVALHTWSHSLLTTKTNIEVVAELGWNMQIIYDLSGRVPQLYRPPQGDLDDRVRAIAAEIFGLRAVMWNAECNDWCIDANGKSECPGEVPGEDASSVKKAIRQALHRPKSPGVSILEHELNDNTVGFFTNYYPSLETLGWKAQAVSDHYGMDWYANAKGNSDTPTNVTSFVVSSNANLPTAASLKKSSKHSQANTNITSSATSSTAGTTANSSGPASTPASTIQGSASDLESGSSALTVSSVFAIASMSLATFFTTL
jgi:chitin deacetylase